MELNGVQIFQVSTHKDYRGELTAFDKEKNMPFEVKRFFYILMPTAGVPRAEHSCTAEQLIIVAQGRARFDIDDGALQKSIELSAGSNALWIKPGRWLRMTALDAQTILIVLASTLFSETRYFDEANPRTSAEQ